MSILVLSRKTGADDTMMRTYLENFFFSRDVSNDDTWNGDAKQSEKLSTNIYKNISSSYSFIHMLIKRIFFFVRIRSRTLSRWALRHQSYCIHSRSYEKKIRFQLYIEQVVDGEGNIRYLFLHRLKKIKYIYNLIVGDEKGNQEGHISTFR